MVKARVKYHARVGYTVECQRAKYKHWHLIGTHTETDKERINHLIDIINGKCPTDYEAKWTVGDDVLEIYYKGKFQFLVRGWGHLTGCGGLNLPGDLAAKMQDGFIAYILNKLNEKE